MTALDSNDFDKGKQDKPKQPKGLLIKPKVALTVPRDELVAYVERCLRLPKDAIRRVTQAGDAKGRLVVELSNDRRMVFAPTKDAFENPKLVAEVAAVAGPILTRELPNPVSGDAIAIAQRLVRIAELVAIDDDRVEVHDWAASFLTQPQRYPIPGLTAALFESADSSLAYTSIVRLKLRGRREPDGRIDTSAAPPPTPTVANQSFALLDPGTGGMIVRCQDFNDHVRSDYGVRESGLSSRLEDIGWKYLPERQWRRPVGYVEEAGIDWPRLARRDHAKVALSVYFIPGENLETAT